MSSAVAAVLNMIVGNPLTGVPGVMLFLSQLGPALTSVGAAMTSVGAGASPWEALANLFQDRYVIEFFIGIGLTGAKDHNVTGGMRRA